MGRSSGLDYYAGIRHRTFVPASDVSIAEVDDGAVLLSLGRGIYYGLNETALFVLRQFDGVRDCDAIVKLLLDAFETDRDTAISDLVTLVKDLEQNGLIAAKDAAAMPR
jgi:hypothetical protein